MARIMDGRHFVIGLWVLLLVACSSGQSSTSPDDQLQQNSTLVLGGAKQYKAMIGLQGVQPYLTDGHYAERLKRCVLAQNEEQACSLKHLPLIGMEHVYPSVDDIMQRVVVSHQWMGQRFEDALLQLPDDVRVLMKGVTAIVLAEDIRPSYYWSLTGAIYIDPYHLWLSAEEKSTFSGLLAGMNNNGKNGKLSFHAWWRYVLDDDFAYRLWADWDDETRNPEQILLPLAATLFHELAHANDYFPPTQLQQLESSWTIPQAVNQLKAWRASERLYDVAPLISPVMFRLAAAIHRDAQLDEQEQLLSAAEVGLEFQMGIANDDYAYISRFEDVAMLFEETMMARHYNLQRDVAYLPRAANEDGAGCDDYTVAWGMRNRLGDPTVKARALQVAEDLMPTRQWSDFFEKLPHPQFLTIGSGWCQSLIVGNDAAALASPLHPSLSEQGFQQQHSTRIHF